jgi:hypothetical protein
LPPQAQWQAFDYTPTRGFTGQEMVDHLGVVNIDGRLYMETGVFASPDPFNTLSGQYSELHSLQLRRQQPA